MSIEKILHDRCESKCELCGAAESLLVADNPEKIEGRVNGQQIVILTKFVKKVK